MTTTKPSPWVSVLWLLSGSFVFLFVSTGIALNHSHSLGLNKKSVANSAVLFLYRDELPNITGVQIESHWLSWQAPDLFFDEEQLLQCKGRFVGGITLPNYWVAACEHDLFVFTYEQELISRVSPKAGINYPIEKIGACEALLCYRANSHQANSHQANNTIYQLDIETLEIAAFSGNEGRALQWSSPEQPPRNIASAIRGQTTRTITWERVIQDIHRGKIFGALGQIIWDLTAFAFLMLFLATCYRHFASR